MIRLSSSFKKSTRAGVGDHPSAVNRHSLPQRRIPWPVKLSEVLFMRLLRPVRLGGSVLQVAQHLKTVRTWKRHLFITASFPLVDLPSKTTRLMLGVVSQTLCSSTRIGSWLAMVSPIKICSTNGRESHGIWPLQVQVNNSSFRNVWSIIKLVRSITQIHLRIC